MITIQNLEKYLFDTELVRIIFRAPSSMIVESYQDKYKYVVGDTNNYNILKQRLESLYKDIPFVLVDGFGITRHDLGRKMGDIRNSYLHDK